MARLEKSTVIRAEPEEVWGMLFWDRIPEWLSGFKSAEYTSEVKDTVGATAHVVSEAAGVKVEWDVEITGYEENERATWRSTGGDVTAIGLTNLERAEGGTRVSFMIDYDLPYSVLGRIVDRLVVGRETERDIERGLETLKRTLEG